MRIATVALAALLLTDPDSAAAQTVPPDASALIGTWQLNTRRTHYGPGVDRRRRERMTCTAVARRVRCVIASVRSDGRALTGQFTAALTGAVAPVQGIPDVDEVRLQVPDSGLVDATFSFRGKPVFGYRAFQADDGRSLMIVALDPITRAPATTIVVYDRR